MSLRFCNLNSIYTNNVCLYEIDDNNINDNTVFFIVPAVFTIYIMMDVVSGGSGTVVFE